MHFFNPPALMELVEVVAGEATGPSRARRSRPRSRERMGRTPIRAADGIGFLANRGARPFGLEALRLLGERVADARPDRPDRADRRRLPDGAVRAQDLIGIDVNLERRPARSASRASASRAGARIRSRSGWSTRGGSGARPARGWYDYDDGPHRPDDPPPLPAPASPPSRDPEAEAGVRWVALPDLRRATVVEIAALPGGDPAALGAAGRYFTALGKHVECTPGEAPGLVLGRIVCQLVNEACFAVGRGGREPGRPRHRPAPRLQPPARPVRVGPRDRPRERASDARGAQRRARCRPLPPGSPPAPLGRRRRPGPAALARPGSGPRPRGRTRPGSEPGRQSSPA